MISETQNSDFSFYWINIMSGTTNLTNISTIFNVDSISVQLIPQKKGKMLQIKSNYVRK